MLSSESNPQSSSWVDKLSEGERSEMIEQISELRKENDSLMAETQEGFFNYLRSLAGAYADVMIQDKNETLKSIHSNSSAIREVALRLAKSHWKIEDDVADQCEYLAQTDQSERVRELAMSILGLSYRDTQEARIGRLLAEAVKRDTYSTPTRLNAYYSLVVVDGKHNYSISPFALSWMAIDWSLVEKYLSISGD